MRGPPLQTRVVAAYGTVLQLANMLVVISNDDPGAHGMNRGKQRKMNGGQELMWAVGMAKAKASRHTARRTKPLQADTAGGFSARHRP